jgi:neutral ceramidase
MNAFPSDFHRLFTVLVLLLPSSVGGLHVEAADLLKVGVARLDITPVEPVQMAGYSARTELSTGIHDPLSVRAFALEHEGRRLLIVSADILGYYRGTYEYVIEGIREGLGIEESDIFLSANHTHSAPTVTLDRETGNPANLRYTEFLRTRIVDAARKALGRMEPARIVVGTGSSPVGVNRRETRPGGAVVLGRNPDGRRDSEVVVVGFLTPQGEPLGVLYNYATHATSLGPRNLLISGDLFGIANGLVEQWRGSDSVAAALVGASGDIDPWYRVLPGFRTDGGWVPETELLGRLLAVEVEHVLDQASAQKGESGIESMATTLLLPGKKRGERGIDPESVQGVEPVPLRLAAARIGDVGLVGMSAEVLTEVGQAIKRGSPFAHTMIVTHCGGAQGYLPPTGLYKEGGYEIETSPFAPGAAEATVREALRMLYELHARTR